jgi:hypothetical protein
LETHSADNAFLVLADADYPGWCVFVDGQTPARANYVQRRGRVPAGEHRVRFVYRPVSVAVGVAISAVSPGDGGGCAPLPSNN